MKKIVAVCSVLFIGLFMMSCSQNKKVENDSVDDDSPAQRMAELVEKINSEGDDYGRTEWYKVMKKTLKIIFAFADSKPSKEEFWEFNEVMEQYNEIIADYFDNNETAGNNIHIGSQKAMDDFDRDYRRAEREKLNALFEKYGKSKHDPLEAMVRDWHI